MRLRQRRSLAATVNRAFSDFYRATSLTSAAVLIVVSFPPNIAKADEGGVSFWLPGIMGSLSAALPQPGFAFANIFYHSPPTGGADIAFARQVTRGNLTVNFTGNLNLSLRAVADMYAAAPSYTFES